MSSKLNRYSVIMKCCGKHFVGIAGILIAAASLCFAIIQFQWQNYNDLNQRYASTLGEMPIEIVKETPADFDTFPNKTKIWVRSYFNLTSEEYYLYKKCLIPKEMWEKRILNGVRVNLRTYPVLIEGFHYWVGKKTFKHPDGFIDLIESQIKKSHKY